MKYATIKIEVIDDVLTPKYQTPGAAAVDLMSSDSWIIQPHTHELVGTGVRIAMPDGFCARILPRSGLALKYGIDVHHGLIDSDYRQEIKVIIKNTSEDQFVIQRGDRIAQMMFQEYIHCAFDFMDIDDNGRGGFGHTGK